MAGRRVTRGDAGWDGHVMGIGVRWARVGWDGLPSGFRDRVGQGGMERVEVLLPGQDEAT